MSRFPASVLVVAFVAAAVPAVATTPQWAALIALDDGGLDPQMIPVVVDSETDCLAALSLYRNAVVIEPCHPVPTASAITDPNDANRTSKTPKPVTEPRDAGRVLGDVGHMGGG